MKNEFSQYKRKSSESKNVVPNDFEKYKRKDNAAPSSVRNVAGLATSVLGAPGNLAQAAHNLFSGAAELINEQFPNVPMTGKRLPWSNRITTVEKEMKENPFTTQQLRNKLAEETGYERGSLEPQGSLEKGAEKFAGLVGEAPVFGGINGVRGALSLGGLAAGLQLGEDQKLGPVGQFITGVGGALLPGGIENLAKGATRAITSPKQTLAKGVSKLVKAPDIKKQLIQDARKVGVQLDLGSITDSGAVKFIQNQIAQSPLVGDALETFKKDLSQQVINEYKSIADTIGEATFQNNFQAGEAVQNAIKANQQSSLDSARKLYDQARNVSNDVIVTNREIKDVVSEIRNSLTPGSVKSPEQSKVIKVLDDLKDGLWKDVSSIESLINNKIALNDIIDYEIQGGSKQLLKRVVKSIDDTLSKYGAFDPKFGNAWKSANKEFAQHAKTYRNTNISNVLKTQDPASIFNKMNTTAGIRDVKKALSHSAEGKSLFNDLSRYKIDDMIGKSLEKNIKDQIQFGKIGNVLKQTKTQELLKELMPKSEFDRLKNLSNLTGNIAESASKFLNTSQSGTTIVNMAAVGKMMSDVGRALSGNFLPLMTSLGGLAGVRGISNLITNPEFLKAVEDAILVSKSSNVRLMEQAGKNLLEAVQIGSRGVPKILNNQSS